MVYKILASQSVAKISKLEDPINKGFWQDNILLRTTDNAKNITIKDPEYIPKLVIKDKDQGQEKTLIDNYAFQH